METLLPSKFVSQSDTEERRARESELRSLTAYRLRLEHEARIADELARIDVLARRLSSRPPPALASVPAAALSAPPPAMSSGRLPCSDSSSGSWPALSMDVVLPDERMADAAPARLSLIAVAIATSALLSFAGLAFVLGPSSQTSKSAAAAQPVAQTQPTTQALAQGAATTPTAAAHATCGTDDAKSAAAVVTAAVATTAAPVSVAPATRTAKRSAHAPRAATPPASPSPAAAPRAATTPDLDQAARTAQMLREQLGTSLH